MEKREPRQSKSLRKRRLVMMALGIGAGLLCRVLPIHYQGPCGIAAKLLYYLVGGP